MSLHSLLPAPDRLHLLSLAADGEEITLTARTCSEVTCCPLCGQPSARVHSRYRHILADLPWQGIPARVLLWTRRFFCDAPNCVRRIFTERLPGVAIPYAHRTDRLCDWFTHVSFALGGEAGARSRPIGWHAPRSSSLSKGSTTPSDATRHSAIVHRWNMKGGGQSALRWPNMELSTKAG